MRLCRCGHPESEHGLYPPHECLIYRNPQYRAETYGSAYACGCERFEEATA